MLSYLNTTQTDFHCGYRNCCYFVCKYLLPC